MAKQSKRKQAALAAVDREQTYPLEKAVSLVKANAAATKFDETIEIAMNLGVDPRHADQMVRGVVAMPNGTGKTMRVAVFARDAKADEAKEAGADLVGAEELAEAIQGGESNFDRVIASPDMMGVVGRLGKVLGPRGLMPNPKLGTVTPDIGAAVKAAKAGEVQYRAEKAGVVHAGIGVAQAVEQLAHTAFQRLHLLLRRRLRSHVCRPRRPPAGSAVVVRVTRLRILLRFPVVRFAVLFHPAE